MADTPYDRQLLLEQAARARAKRQRRRAIALYRQALAEERSSAEIHERLAPLLAETGQEFDAWNSYRAVAHAALRAGREDRAIAVFREATRALPREIQAWQGLARLLVRQGEEAAAVEALMEGSRQFGAHWNRPQAIHLLRRARTIDPWHHETVIELARHLGRADQVAEARLLLDALALRTEERKLRRVRAAQLAVCRTPRALWSWLVTWLPDRGTEITPAARGARPADIVSLRSVAPPSDLPVSRESDPAVAEDEFQGDVKSG